MTGKHLYQCDDCKNKQYMHLKEFHRAARPHCMKCGSTRLEPFSQAAQDEILSRNTERGKK